MFPPIPDWDGLHPLIIHFPIALLLIAPVFMLVAIVSSRLHRVFAIVALILMVIGTAAAFVAVETGEAAAELAIRTGGVAEVLERHEELAETTAMFFTFLTIAFALLAIGPALLKKPLNRAIIVPAHVLFLLVYLTGTVVLANTAHEGGRLVHEHGVHAFVAASTTGSSGHVEPEANE
jgi:uncharacterized membrane protein